MGARGRIHSQRILINLLSRQCVIFGSCPHPLSSVCFFLLLCPLGVFGLGVSQASRFSLTKARLVCLGSGFPKAADTSTLTKARLARSKAECGSVASSASIVVNTTMGSKGLSQNRYGGNVHILCFLYFWVPWCLVHSG